MDMEKTRAIIADPSQTFLEGVRAMIEELFDYVVMVADEKSMIDAATMLGADLVLVDMSIGARVLGDAVRAIKADFPSLKVIVMSSHDESVALQKAFSIGADGFVLKRNAATELIPAIERVMAGGSFFPTHR